MPETNKGTYLKFILFAFFAFNICACSEKENKADTVIKRQLQNVDSLVIAGRADSAINVLMALRNKINNSSPYLSIYYCVMSEDLVRGTELKSLYADSAMAFFSTDAKIKKYPAEYFKAVITKGDACLNAEKYLTALSYYYEAKKVLSAGNVCDNGALASKIGEIYYGQRNFRLSARYWAESYKRLGMCDEKITAQKLFFMQQGAIDNAAYAYTRAGILDSASYYYLLDLKLINIADNDKHIQKYYTNAARVVLYDNLGGLYLKKGNLPAAKDYLLKCLAIPHSVTAGAIITPYIKLANVYTQSGQYSNAADAFAKSRALLNQAPVGNGDADVEWNKLYAQYLFKRNDAANAYRYEDIYIKERDSLNTGLSALYRIDVERELEGIHQQQVVAQLKQRDAFKQFYLAAAIVIALLLAVIIAMINRNLRKTQKSHKITTQHNQQLQHTLAELERVNKNYIRVMRVMAHDLRNPLSGMTGLAAMLIDEDEFSEDSKYMLKLIETTGIHSMEMISELLKSGLADENEKLVTQKIDLKSLLYDSVELLQFKANDKQQQIKYESDNIPLFAEINHEKIWRVVNNLIVNAIKFSHPGGIIKVNVKSAKHHVLISVADNGIGIPSSQKDEIFEMFTTAKKVGTNGEEPFGLGLSISKKIVELHKGRIWFEDNPNGGTIFYIELPQAE
jgi:signal transduction histidine kinase